MTSVASTERHIKKLGNEFLTTVADVNSRSETGNHIIVLNYFPESFEELEDYFNAAKKALREGRIDLRSGDAMKEILKDCRSVNDIDKKMSKAIAYLKEKKINRYTKEIRETPGVHSLTPEDVDLMDERSTYLGEKWTRTQINDTLPLLNYIHLRRADIRKEKSPLKSRHLLISRKGLDCTPRSIYILR